MTEVSSKAASTPEVDQATGPQEARLTAVPPRPATWHPSKRCPTTTPEPHLLGEFPMTCYRCHVEADS